jgi:hypothetical protein
MRISKSDQNAEDVEQSLSLHQYSTIVCEEKVEEEGL